MRHFNITYTRNYNVRYKRAGNLYQGRYKSILVDKESYLSMLSRYIHLNPVKIKSQWSEGGVFIFQERLQMYEV